MQHRSVAFSSRKSHLKALNKGTFTLILLSPDLSTPAPVSTHHSAASLLKIVSLDFTY
jgi:hypothetical protein